jgi:4-diphosphocytidyl-2-C-methyl-D-erythritol kinase
MHKITIRAPAKINLFLRVLNKRNDGYHNIYSWFQAIDLFDYLEFEKRSENGIRLIIENDIDLPRGENNLIVKTAKLLFEKYNLPGGLNILLEKNIPIAAGLGGGSSDAAATIYAINRIFDLNFSNEKMKQLGLEIGSDVPFFFSSGQAEVTGRGEIIKDITLPANYSILLVVPRIAVSTAESYRRLNLGLTSSGDVVRLANCKTFGELIARLGRVGNDFEEVGLEFPVMLGEIRDMINKTGAVLTRMSGTGPTIFGLCENALGKDSWRDINGKGWFVFWGHPITLPAWKPANDNRPLWRKDKT